MHVSCRKRCCEAIKLTFVNEGKHGGEATVEAVRLIADQVKIHDYQLHPDSLDVCVVVFLIHVFYSFSPHSNVYSVICIRNFDCHFADNCCSYASEKYIVLMLDLFILFYWHFFILLGLFVLEI